MSRSRAIAACFAAGLALMTLTMIAVEGATPLSVTPSVQEKPVPKEEKAGKDEKESATVVTGILVDEKGTPVKAKAVELYMVAEGFARDAFGAPLRGAFTVGPNKQILGFQLGTIKSETDATGRFSLELPKYLFVLSGIKPTGFTIVRIEEESGEVRVLSFGGEMVTIALKPDSKKIDLGKLSLSPKPVGKM